MPVADWGSSAGICRPMRCFAFGCLLLFLPAPVSAQQTRQDEARKRREEKSRALKTYKPGKIELGLIKLEEGKYLERLFNPQNGFFPQLGHLTPGAGLAFGAGYRAHRLFGGNVDLLATVTTSNKRYFKAEGSARLPRLANNHAFAEGTITRSNFPGEDFYGLGPDTEPGTRTNFSLRNTSFSAGGGVRPFPWLSVGERVEYLTPKVSPGADDNSPSIEALFTESDAPGLTSQPDFIRLQTFADLDYRRPGPNGRKGGRYFGSYSRFNDRGDGRFSFDRWDFDLQQYISVLKDHRTLALRAMMVFSSADPGGDVPFYLQPWLGGSHMLRGVRSFRFRDRNLVLLQAEYRWQILAFLSGALFYDRGMVAPDKRSFDWDRMEDDYGFGLRFGMASGVFLRTDVVFGGGEGTRFLLRFNNVF